MLRRISLGDSNKAAAKRLGISPVTVRTHLERVFKKLGCKTRAACTLQAPLLGFLNVGGGMKGLGIERCCDAVLDDDLTGFFSVPGPRPWVPGIRR